MESFLHIYLIVLCFCLIQTGRGVPVIIPGETKDALEFIANEEVRGHVGIHPKNPYLFAAREC